MGRLESHLNELEEKTAKKIFYQSSMIFNHVCNTDYKSMVTQNNIIFVHILSHFQNLMVWVLNDQYKSLSVDSKVFQILIERY